MDSNMRGLLAIGLGLMLAGVITGWMLHPPTGDPNALAVLNSLTGALTAAFLQSVNFYFNSSSGSKAKDATISGIAASTVPAAAAPSNVTTLPKAG